jgi:hypothetical protein
MWPLAAHASADGAASMVRRPYTERPSGLRRAMRSRALVCADRTQNTTSVLVRDEKPLR